MRHVAVVLGCAVALAAVVILLLDRGGGTRREEIRSDAEDPTLASGAASHAADTWSQPLAPASKPRPFADMDQRMPQVEDDALRVLVVDDATGIPVPGAEVAWRKSVADERHVGPYRLSSPLLSDFDHAPQKTVADARGVARVRTCDQLAIAARQGDRFGIRTFAAAPRAEVRLRLMAGPFLAARVMTEGGSPVAGMTVLFSVAGAQSHGMPIAAISRAPDGLAVAHHRAARPEDFEGDVVVIQAQILGAPPKDRVYVPLGKLKEGPVTLVAPAHGRVVVTLLDPAGIQITEDATVRLNAAADSEWAFLDLQAEARNGVAEFPSVPAGARVLLSVQAPSFDSVNHTVEGAVEPGRTLAAVVRLARRKAIVTGRAVDETRAPIRSRELLVDVVDVHGNALLGSALRPTTDTQGGFRVEVDRTLFAPWEAGFEIEVRDGDALERQGAIAPTFSEGSYVALGDVRLVPPPVLASGIVVDDLGAPLEGALVSISGWQGGAIGGTIMIRLGGRKPLSDRLRTRTDASGQFGMPALPNNRASRIASFEVTAELAGYTATRRWEALSPGVKDLKIVLHGTGIVGGRVDLPEGAPIGNLEMVVTRMEGGDPVDHQNFRDVVDSEGRFRLDGILPGAVTLAVRLRGTPDPLATIADIAVGRLAMAPDPRLRSIDLRQQPALSR